MVVIKTNTRILIVFLIFFCFSCKKDTDKVITVKKRENSAKTSNKNINDSLLKIKKRNESYSIIIKNNKKFISSLRFQKLNFNNKNDFSRIKLVLLETPNEINFSHLQIQPNENGIVFQNFNLKNYLEYKKPFKEYLPFINNFSKEIDFIISYNEKEEIPLKISFKKGQYFWFGKNYKWITPRVKIDDSLIDYQKVINKNSFSEANNQQIIKEGKFLEFNNKKYLLFIIQNGIWNIHHLFDITVETKIKYYIINSIYTNEEGYNDYNSDNKLDFKQCYYYLRNEIDKKHNKYKTYTIN